MGCKAFLGFLRWMNERYACMQKFLCISWEIGSCIYNTNAKEVGQVARMLLWQMMTGTLHVCFNFCSVQGSNWHGQCPERFFGGIT